MVPTPTAPGGDASRHPFDRAAPIDLHTHSNVSDGTESPAELVRAAAEAGVGTIAITDHDSVAGWPEASAEARARGLSLVPGIEFSTMLDHSSVHVLGYLPDPLHRGLVDEIARVRDERIGRAERMVRRISADYDLSWDDVLAQTQEGTTVGRPHIADALVAKGIVSDRSAAFAGILHWQGGYYRPHYAPPPTNAIEILRDAGAVPVLAHPASRGWRTLDRRVMRSLVDAGLLGLEVDHRENDAEGRALLREYAREFDLVVTGSSDYHGAGKPNRLAEHSTEPAQLDRILDAGTGARPVFGASAASGGAAAPV